MGQAKPATADRADRRSLLLESLRRRRTQQSLRRRWAAHRAGAANLRAYPSVRT